MARGVNKVILIGNCGADPEVKYMPNGNAVVNITLATSENWKDKNTGQQVDKTEWHRVVFFSRLAEIVGEYVRKGAKIYIEGRLQTRSWEQDGQKKYMTEVIADNITMLGSKGDTGGKQSEPAQGGGEPPAAPDDTADEDDDLPF